MRAAPAQPQDWPRAMRPAGRVAKPGPNGVARPGTFIAPGGRTVDRDGDGGAADWSGVPARTPGSGARPIGRRGQAGGGGTWRAATCVLPDAFPGPVSSSAGASSGAPRRPVD